MAWVLPLSRSSCCVTGQTTKPSFISPVADSTYMMPLSEPRKTIVLVFTW
ncbi:MAG: hypothetical protein GWP56_19175 [Gammaproteobacteria bacterium]|nr:hypothetical protein [Gammaproteobacteria bacterium]